MESKQVIVMKKFPKNRNLRHGKYIAQGSHASVGALFSIGKISEDGQTLTIPLDNPFINNWVVGNFKKVVCYVETDEALIEIYNQAKGAGIAVSLIRDAGLTEFNGVSTLTAVGIGPDDSKKVDLVTGSLPLF